MSQSVKKFIQYFLIVVVGGYFIYLVFNGTNWTELFSKISGADMRWLAAGMLISIASHWIRAYRATLMYEALHFKVKTSNSFHAVLIGYMMNYFIPRAGEVSRCAALSKTDDIPLEKSLGTVVTERIVDLAFLVLILGAIVLMQFDTITQFIADSTNSATQQGQNSTNILKWIIGGVLAAGVAGVALFWKKLTQTALFTRIFGLFQGFADGLLSIRHIRKPGLYIFLSALIWIGYILMMYFCLFSMEATSHLSISDCLTVFALGTIGVALPAPGAGAGSYHFFVMKALLIFGVAAEDGKAYATMVHGGQMVLLIILGIISSVYVMQLQKKKNNV